MKRLALAAAGAAALVAASFAPVALDQPGRFTCHVERILDGDTWTCAGIVARVRAWGYDSADFRCKGRRYCREDVPQALADKAYVRLLIAGRTLECEAKDTDKYGRIVARCSYEGRDIGCQMIRAGHALEMPRFSRGAYRDCKP